MASSSRSTNCCATGVGVVVLLSALTMMRSWAYADPAAPPAPSPPAAASPQPIAAAEPIAPATPASSAALESAELVREIQVQLARIVPGELRIDGVTLGCKPPAGATLKAVAPGLTSLTSRSFMVELQSGDRSLFCSAMMMASRQVLAATHDLTPDAAVVETDFAPSWVDAFSITPGALASFPGQGPYVSATLLRAGQPLYQNSLKRPIAVHPGEMVTVLVKNGPITVHAQLQAQSQAAVGDTATMINPSSGMPVAVTITGPRLAELVMQ